MSSERGANKRHHNPVDSICRKIKSIQMMDQVSNPALQIPKFQSRNFDSPQCNVKKNLEEILKKRTFRSRNSTSPPFFSPSSDSVFSADLQLLSPCSRRISDCSSADTTYSVIKREEKTSNPWLPVCSMDSCSPPYFTSREENAQNQQCALASIESEDVHREQKYVTSSPHLLLFASDRKLESPAIQPPVPKRSSLSERGQKQLWGCKTDDMYDVSLICEEDLLTTIFHACDIKHTGKVAVSKIVDYLRHTTSRGLEDSGLEELCNMLDPDQKDVSVDLETYHAIMKEWIEDCKRRWDDSATEEPTASIEDLEFKVHRNTFEVKKTPLWMNVTSGSLEAFGGDVSKGDMETSDLITCVADLQYNNLKLQEENSKLKLTLEAVDETNNKLLADNENLRQQIKSIQHSVLKAKSLEEELEEAKNNLNLLEEKGQKILCQNKQLEKENQSLLIKIASLQEENIRNSMDTDGLQKKILDLSKNAAELQMQVHIYESTVINKEASLIQKEQDIKELKLTIVECTSIIETLRAEKSKLLEDMRHMQQELISNGLSFPLMSKVNGNIPEEMNSLDCELELAQSSEITKTEWMSLDETLDREVLFLLQGPEYAGEKFKAVMQNLQEEASAAEELVKTSLEWVEDPDVNVQQAWERKLVVLKQELGEKRHLWIQKLNLLEKHKESLDKDFIRMASNLRRTKTEQLHLRKELSARQREIETVKQLQEEAAGQAEALGLELQKATKQLEDISKQREDQAEAFHSACEEAASLKCQLKEAISEQQKLKDVNAALTSTCQLLQEKVEEQKTTVIALRGELLKERLCERLYQLCVDEESVYSLLPTSVEPVKGKGSRANRKTLWSERSTLCTKFPRTLPSDISYWSFTPLLDALNLETSCPINFPAHSWNPPCRWRSVTSLFESCGLWHASISDVTSVGSKWKIYSAGGYTDSDLPVSITMMDSSLTEMDCAEPSIPLGLIPSSDGLTSPQELPTSSSESTALVTGCFVMEEKLPKNSCAKEEAVPTSVTMERNNDQDVAGSVSEPDLIKESTSMMEEHKADPMKKDLEMENEATKEQSEVTPAVVPSRKGSSPSTGGLKGDKAKQNELDFPSEKEVEAEFLRLSLGFKCDLFTLDKRVRLEERSRELAEENLKKEITNALKMLEALVPLCEEDNQAQEIIKKLQKSLQFLSQYAARVASRAEMLGAINQESRISKAVEVMIQHVENLKRMYAKEHAELEELKQVLLQNERSFCSLGDRDESTNKKLPNSFNFKPSPSLRRVSIATLPRSAGNAGVGVPLAQLQETGGDEWSDKFNRRSSSWGRLGARQNEKRPSLQRFISTYSWTEYEDEHSETKNEQLELPAEMQEQLSRKESTSEKGKCPSKWNLKSACNFVSSWASHFKTSFSNANKTLWVSVSILVLLAAFTSFLTGLSLQRPADAAPVGTGDSWTSLQQLLWPYTGLQHNGPPPV
ncbi:lymphoid-restricted membrane protein isoform X1 [Phasianus colchicus]|uniref:lymphoid-restricted membrane protein isoform X1 n=1 Tax=Phasianus colchicus TaxID=9054 RepID=UPI00129E4875|nr:lymphoid-restricted membrane protein isoform X1 [Phasianus colchicus]XP_031453016.1 lymphoid-restricted membrane protein isoform X1 [Phasianus colchicus]XP_031453017.1 lymphoid-restricted membrane protein isoform X1 [Phasianus colchicus]